MTSYEVTVKPLSRCFATWLTSVHVHLQEERVGGGARTLSGMAASRPDVCSTCDTYSRSAPGDSASSCCCPSRLISTSLSARHRQKCYKARREGQFRCRARCRHGRSLDAACGWDQCGSVATSGQHSSRFVRAVQAVVWCGQGLRQMGCANPSAVLAAASGGKPLSPASLRTSSASSSSDAEPVWALPGLRLDPLWALRALPFCRYPAPESAGVATCIPSCEARGGLPPLYSGHDNATRQVAAHQVRRLQLEM